MGLRIWRRQRLRLALPTQAASPFKTEPQKTETVIFGEQEAEVPPANDFDDEIPF